jgi:peptidyl-prolyl cis-trans isomerase D
LKQLGIDQRIVQQMIQEEASLAEARRLGIKASDAEVRERILSLPAFQENGQFIGDQRYRQLLRMQSPPMRPDEFEDQVRRSVVVEKLQAALTGWMTVDDKDVVDEFKKRNERVKVMVANFPADKFREGLVASDAEVAKHFEDHKDSYRIGEKRKIRYLTIDQEALRARATVTGQQIERSYNDNIQQYSTPEQVRASHILLKTEGKDDAAVKKQAEDLLAQIKKGGNFEELAKKNSQDTVSAAKGGDLDFFNKGQMVPEFDKVAFELQPGQMSDLVKSSFGYHIIKVTGKKPATTRTLEEVRTQIEDQLKSEQAQTAAQKLADQVAGELKKPADFDTVARARSLQGGESGLFTQDEPVIAGIGSSPQVAQTAFTLKEGEVSEALRTSQGYSFITVTGKQDPYIPKLDEVKTKVRDDVLNQKAIDAARQKAASITASLKSGDFEKAAKAAGLDVKTTELITRGAPIGDAPSPALEAAAFALPQGGVSDPVVTDKGAAILKVVERKEVVADELAKQKDSLKNEILNERKNKFFAAYMTKARTKMKINVNRETIAQIVG